MRVFDTLDRKLLRDFRRLWVQLVAIALVLGCGVAIMLISLGMYGALGETRQAYYERNRFADVFVSTRRAPESLMSEVRAIPGVRQAEARVSGTAILDLPLVEQLAVGRVLSLPPDNLPLLNAPVLRSGRLPDPDSASEVMVNEPFAEAHGFRPGDSFLANLNGTRRLLQITGTALSPEFIYTIGPGALMPDNTTFGILWMPHRTAAAAFDMVGAFNTLSIGLGAGQSAQPVIEALDRLFEPYGGLGAHDRSLHPSDQFISAEIAQLRGMAVILPPAFFAIAAFLVSMVMGRIVTLERSEIGLLKAVGYSNGEILLHYQMLAGLVALVGIVFGWIGGYLLARLLAEQYARFFDFPFLIFRMSPTIYALTGFAALLTTALGAARSARRAAALPPAIAMQPPAPPRFRRSIADDAMRLARLRQSSVMVLRSILRWPVRSALTTLGLAFAVASVVSASFITDAMDEVIESAFFEANRQDATLLFTNEIPLSALPELGRLPGVLTVEGQTAQPAILRNGSREKRLAVEGRSADADLSRVVDSNGFTVPVPPGGIVLSDRLADYLRLRPGDSLEVEFLSGPRDTVEVILGGTVRQYFGLGAYMDLAELNRLFRQAPMISAANVRLDSGQEAELHAAIKTMPRLAGATMLTDVRTSFQETLEENIMVMNAIYVGIAVLITIGVAYNTARIQLSERARELASLRILGFSRAEVSYVLIASIMLLALAAQPLGWLIGAWISQAMTRAFSSDLYTIPLVLHPATFASASLVVLGAAAASVLVVQRRLNRLNLVAVMKTRE